MALEDRNRVMLLWTRQHRVLEETSQDHCCLEPVEVPFVLSIAEELDMSQSEEERVEALDEQPYISGYFLDVDRLVQNELMVNLPMKVLCREDCRGICSQCGRNLNHGKCDCDNQPKDPRMAAIQDIYKKFNMQST